MKSRMMKASLLFLSIMVGFGIFVSAQPDTDKKILMDRVTVPLTKPGQPVSIKVNGPEEGDVRVVGTDGQEVVIETYRLEESSSDRAIEPKRKTDGLRLIKGRSSNLRAEEENNAVWIDLGHASDTLDVIIKVPRRCSLSLKTSDGDILVENVSGDLEVESSGGNVVLTGISGSVVASSAEGDITVVLTGVAPGKLMSFGTVEGDVDVTLPQDTKATIKVKMEEGDFYTDFDINLQRAQDKMPGKEERQEGEIFRVDVEWIQSGTINGGGPEYKFYSMEGDIYLRKKK